MNIPNDAPLDTIIQAQWAEQEPFRPAQVSLIDGKRVWGVYSENNLLTRKLDPPIDWARIVKRSQSLDIRSRGKV